MGAILPATGEKFVTAKEMGIDLQAVLDKTITPTPEQLQMLADKNIMDHYPVFAGFQITNLYEFFLVFVILTGVASVLLFALVPTLKKMMHGVH